MGDSANAGPACPATLVAWGKALPTPQTAEVAFLMPSGPLLPSCSRKEELHPSRPPSLSGKALRKVS